jgi:hypothetical protein
VSPEEHAEVPVAEAKEQALSSSQAVTGSLPTAQSATARVLALQRLAGNRAVSDALERSGSRGLRERVGVTPSRRRLARDDKPPPVDRFAGTLVDYIVINRSSNSAVFHTATGFEILGSVSTDLQPGSYTVKPDRAHVDRAKGESMRWVFDPGQVREGMRFDVTLKGALPETLVYPETVPVTVTVGVSSAEIRQLIKKLHDLVGTRDRSVSASKPFSVEEFVASGFTGGHPYDGDFKDGCKLLQSLNEADLAEVLAGSTTDVWQNLLINFDKAVADGLADHRLLTMLDRLEWGEKAADKLYVDNFTSYGVDRRSYTRDPEREKRGLWNIQIIFHYANLTPERAISVYYDDILDADVKPPASNSVGLWGLIYPAVLTKGTVPRMWDAKRKVREKMEAGNFEFVFTAFQATQLMIDLVGLGSGFLMRTIPAATTGRGPGGYRGPFGTAGRKPQEIYPYVNRNPKASTNEVRLGTELDRLAQTRHLGDDVARVYGAAESKVPGVRSGDYRFVKVDGSELRADAVHPKTAKTDGIYGRIMEKSGTQADVVVVELVEGESVNVSVADAQSTADSAIAASRESSLKLQRVIFVKNGEVIVDAVK